MRSAVAGIGGAEGAKSVCCGVAIPMSTVPVAASADGLGPKFTHCSICRVTRDIASGDPRINEYRVRAWV